tara:strand:- start:477 stop:959 length:483 start_codon:yes stop_codon:yes gene_type:complete
MDHLGPYSVTQLRHFAREFSPTAENGTVVLSAKDNLPEAAEALAGGHPVILLWRETPDFGHFILLHVRHPRGRPDVELFDPLGSTTADRAWDSYMDDPTELNGGGLRPYLRELDRGNIDLSYNQPSTAPQEENTNSCGLWCLLRAGFGKMSPSEFGRIST